MASRLDRTIHKIEAAHGYDFWHMPMRTLERLSDWYGRLCWLVDRCAGYAARQSDLDGIRRNRILCEQDGEVVK